jgi:hypothetical protein
VEVLEPFTLPRTLGERLRADERGAHAERPAEGGGERAGIPRVEEQGGEARARPEAELARQRLEHRIIA